MKEIAGRYATAVVYTDIIEEQASEQIRTLCDQPFAQGCSIRIMPDVHAGKGCVVGFTADLGARVIPSIVGVDIGCGMLTIELGREPVDFEELDRIIRAHVPAGNSVHNSPQTKFVMLEELACREYLKKIERLHSSIGTLGGGNHFIEVDADDTGMQYLVIHTGSRNLGRQVADHYIREAGKQLKEQIDAGLPRELCWLEGELREAYLHDMRICQTFAAENRRAIAQAILTRLTGKPLEAFPSFETVHNYIDSQDGVIRKGAVSAKVGERLLIPINMRDGSLICIGKGNPAWNCSAPHGAGRLFSRSEACEKFTVEAYREAMKGIFTTSVGSDTLDECPMAYKPMESIVRNIAPTVEIERVIRPLYNFKAGQ